MRRITALLLLSVGYAALATFDTQIAALPALTSFLAAALVLNGTGRPQGRPVAR